MLSMVFTVFKLYSNDLLAENRRLPRANSSRPASIKTCQLANFRIVFSLQTLASKVLFPFLFLTVSSICKQGLIKGLYFNLNIMTDLGLLLHKSLLLSKGQYFEATMLLKVN